MEPYIVYPTKEQKKALEAFLEASEIWYDKEVDINELPDHV